MSHLTKIDLNCASPTLGSLKGILHSQHSMRTKVCSLSYCVAFVRAYMMRPRGAFILGLQYILSPYSVAINVTF